MCGVPLTECIRPGALPRLEALAMDSLFIIASDEFLSSLELHLKVIFIHNNIVPL
jgi:hypothetical protein